MAKTEILRTVVFDEDTRELLQEIRETMKGQRSFLDEVDALLGEFMRVAAFDISEEVTDDGEAPTFTFADLG